MKQAHMIIASVLMGSQAWHSPVFAHPAAGGRGYEPAVCLAPPGAASNLPLLSRVGPPDPAVLDIFSGSGASAILVHDLTLGERALVDKALAKLPRRKRGLQAADYAACAVG